MARIRKALLGSAFQYIQFALALVSGFVLFPLIVWNIGAYDNGLWLVSGELIGYLLLGDLGVFAVLPWLVASKDGAGDLPAVSRYLADGLVVGLVVGIGVVAVAVGVWYLHPGWVGMNPADWAKVRGPLALLLLLTGIGFPFRAFAAVLGGLQDVVFLGFGNVVQAALTVTLTATLILLGFGLPGLAVSVGVPPLLLGLATGVRLFVRYPEVARGCHRPVLAGCRNLIAQGFGVWLGSFGVRLLSASNGLIMVALGRPDWATIYAATGKVAQVSQQLCWVIPDSGLIGLSQLYGERDPPRTRRAVLCLLLLYLLIPGGAAIGLLVGNPWFVRAWLGRDLYAGDYVSGLLVLNLLVSSAVSGLYKVVAVVGNRVRIATATVIYGLSAAGLGFLLARERGLAGLAEGAIIAGAVIAIPFGVCWCRAVYQISLRELAVYCFSRWAVRTMPLLAAAAAVGCYVADAPAGVVAAGIGFGVGYVILLRPVIAGSPWPAQVRDWLLRLHLIPSPHGSVVSPSLKPHVEAGR